MSYGSIEAQIRTLAADDSVRGIVLDIDTPGGEATGACELAALVRQVALVKPVAAFVNGLAASAGYAIAAGASRIVTTKSSFLGSIGVVVLHLDQSEQMSEEGLKPTLVYAGARKIDASPLGPLSDGAKMRLQAMVDGIYGLLVTSMAGHRSGLSEAQVRATDGGLYMGPQAVEIELADAIGSLDDALKWVRGSSRPTAAAPANVTPAASGPAVGKPKARASAPVETFAIDGRALIAARARLKVRLGVYG